MKKGVGIIIVAALSLGGFVGSQRVCAEVVKVHLGNGDQLTGELIQDDAIVLIEHETLGDIEIPKKKIKRIDRPSQKKPPAASASETPSEESLESRSPLLGFVNAFRLEKWNKQFEFGMNTQSGRKDKVDFTARYGMRRRMGKNDYRIEARKYYGESGQDKTTDRDYANFRWRRDLSPGLFYETNTVYSSDAIKEIDLNLDQKFGLGYRFVNRKNLKVSTGMGLSGRYREDATSNNRSTYLVDTFEDVDYRLNERIRLTQEFRIALPPEESDNYEYEFRAAIVSKVTDSLHLSVRYQLEYDKSLPKDRREDQRIVSSIGFDF